MGPKFEERLYFQADRALEVCGPTNFGPDDMMFELKRVTVVDKNGRERHVSVSLFFTRGEMWETDIPDATGELAIGPAAGTGKGKVTRRDGSKKDVDWVGQFELIDAQTFLSTLQGN
jgi:hypothetical protein